MPAKKTGPASPAPATGRREERLLPLRVTVRRPPAGVQLCLQRGASELVFPVIPDGAEDVSFDFSVRAKDVGEDAPPRLLGEFVQGPTNARFVYVCVGTSAGQTGSCWTRRAKVPLAGITRPLIDAVLARPGARLAGGYDGTGRDGSPTCASVKLVAGWQVTE